MSTLNREKWLQITQNGVDNLYGERRKNAMLLKEAIQTQPEGTIHVEKVIFAINQATAHADTKIDAIKMAKTLNNKIVAIQEMKDILAEEEKEARKREQKNTEFAEMSVEEQAQMVKLSDDPVLNFELHKLNQKIGANMGRKRPRNPSEWLQLKKWERERGGEKIGEIGPMPTELMEQMKVLIKVRQQDESGFIDITDFDWDKI